MSHLYDAKELKKDYPEETKGFDIFQVERIWEEYSDMMAAGWLTPDQEMVERVFNDFRITDSYNQALDDVLALLKGKQE